MKCGAIASGKVAVILLLRTLCAGRVNLASIKPPPTLFVLEQILGDGDLLEAGFVSLIIGM